MSYVWGGQSGRMQVGIQVRTDAYDTNTPSIAVYVDLAVRVVNYRYNDAQVLHLRGSVAADYGFQNYQASSGTHEFHVATYTIHGQGQNYGGGPTYYFELSLSGAFDNSAPSVGVNWSLPPRPPNVPTPPGISWGEIGANHIDIIIHASDGRGLGVDAYQTLVGTNGNSVDTIINSQVANFGGGSGRVWGLTRYGAYAAIARAHNGVGWSNWAGPAFFRTLPTAPSPIPWLTVAPLGPESADFHWNPPADDGGGTITSYGLQVATDENFANVVKMQGTDIVTGLIPGTRYWARVRSGNSHGLISDWSPSVQFDTMSGAKVFMGTKLLANGTWEGSWKNVPVRVKQGGAWVVAKVYKKKSDGTWVI